MSERKEFELMALGAKDAFLKISDEETFSKEVMWGLQILRGSAYLQKCDPQSIKNSITNIALTGATLNPAKQQAFLVPRNVKINGVKTMICCLDISYRGLIKIATDSGSVLHWDAVEIFKGDDFKIIQGTEDPHIHHIPKFPRGPKAELIGVYSRATLHEGGKPFLIMEGYEIENTRNTSQCPDSPAWKNHYGEMAKKTAMKRHYKTLPQTDRMSEAIKVLNDHEGLEITKKGDKGKDLLNRFDCGGSEDTPFEEMKEAPRGEEAPVEKKETAASPEKKEAAKPKGSASEAQIKKVKDLFTTMGMKEEEAQLDWIGFNFDEPLPSIDGLSKDLANKVIKELEAKAK